MSRLLLHALVAIGLSGPLVVPLHVVAQGLSQTATLEVIPPDPTSEDAITLRLCGEWRNLCTPKDPQVSITGNVIDISTNGLPPGGACPVGPLTCGLAITPWCIDAPIIGRLAAGTYNVGMTYELCDASESVALVPDSFGVTGGPVTCNVTVPIDYFTIQGAVDALPNPAPQTGWTVCVNDGKYNESVKISQKNTSATSSSQTVVIRATNRGGATVTPVGPLGSAQRFHAFSIESSRFITVKGFVLTGASREAIFLRGGAELANSDITVDSNNIHDNGSGNPAWNQSSTNGGVFIGRNNPGTWLVNNRIVRNGRNGLVIEGGSAADTPKYIVNNTIGFNGWNGLSIARSEGVFLVNNLVIGNGYDIGTTGGRFGLKRESVAPGAGPGKRGLITLLHNMFYGHGEDGRYDIDNVVQTLDSSDGGNYTTSGTEVERCLGGAGGCPLAIVGCVFASCSTHVEPLSDLIVDGAIDPFNVHLPAGSPAIDRGLGSFVDNGKEWVPGADHYGEARPAGASVDIGYDEWYP